MRHSAFTTRWQGRVSVLLTKVRVSEPVTQEEAQQRKVKLLEYWAIWDTGATNSAITKKVASDLGLQPTGLVEVRYGSGKAVTKTYLVNIGLPNGLMVGQVRVTEAQGIADDDVSDDKQPHLLIGMDIIGMGDFAVTNANRCTALSFRVPSTREIDFIPDAEDYNIKATGANRHQRRAMKAQLRRRK